MFRLNQNYNESVRLLRTETLTQKFRNFDFGTTNYGPYIETFAWVLWSAGVKIIIWNRLSFEVKMECINGLDSENRFSADISDNGPTLTGRFIDLLV